MNKRILSFVLVLALCIGLLSGISFNASAATVNYVTGNPSSKYQNVIKNWGTRGTTATFLSPNAEKFYKNNNITYEDLAKLSGSSNTTSVPSSALYKALKELDVEEYDQVLIAYSVDSMIHESYPAQLRQLRLQQESRMENTEE